MVILMLGRNRGPKECLKTLCSFSALLEAVHRRAVLVLPGRELPHRGQELLGQVLEDQAVRLQGDDVARRDLAQVVADLRDGHVLLSHDVVVEGPQRVVAEELRRVDVVPVHLAGGVREGLAPLAAPPVQLVVAGAHRVEQVLVPGPETDEGVDRELGHVLLALRPGVLHGFQGLGQAPWLHVRHLKSAQVAWPVSSRYAAAGLLYQPRPR